jgi:hypothetical protein
MVYFDMAVARFEAAIGFLIGSGRSASTNQRAIASGIRGFYGGAD